VQILNDFRPWRGTLRGQMTMSDLLACNTLNPESAAALWWTLEHGASIFVTAGPPGACKSTVANALLEFLPQHASVYVTSGGWDRLDLTATTTTSGGPVYLLINELSAHLSVYLYGDAAHRAFDLLRSGVRMLGTLHAPSVAEAVRVMCYEGEIERSDITAPFVFVVVSAGWSGRDIVRHVDEIGFLAPDGKLATVAVRTADALHLQPAGVGALANWSDLGTNAVECAIAEHAQRLMARIAPR
jgi:hypothetical protein